jgi:hypothetical protein
MDMPSRISMRCDHVFWRGKMYNGFDATEVGSHGARKCAIDVAADGIVGRGVLLDIAKVKNLQWLEPGERIFPEDLDAAEREHRVEVGEGDILLIRNGRARRRKTSVRGLRCRPCPASTHRVCNGFTTGKSQ